MILQVFVSESCARTWDQFLCFLLSLSLICVRTWPSLSAIHQIIKSEKVGLKGAPFETSFDLETNQHPPLILHTTVSNLNYTPRLSLAQRVLPSILTRLVSFSGFISIKAVSLLLLRFLILTKIYETVKLYPYESRNAVHTSYIFLG